MPIFVLKPRRIARSPSLLTSAVLHFIIPSILPIIIKLCIEFLALANFGVPEAKAKGYKMAAFSIMFA
jgi:hypothetical protein